MVEDQASLSCLGISRAISDAFREDRQVTRASRGRRQLAVGLGAHDGALVLRNDKPPIHSR
jgi:hypothetical protein